MLWKFKTAQLLQHYRRQRDGSSKTIFESPNTRPLELQQNHRRQRDGSSKTMFKPLHVITQPLLLRNITSMYKNTLRQSHPKLQFKD